MVSQVVPGMYDISALSEDSDVQTQPLTELQMKVVKTLADNEGIDARALAEMVGCTRQSVYQILSKQHVRAYILQNVHASLLISADAAMQAQLSLLKSKSEYIKHKAATDILDRNEIGTRNTIIGQSVNVKIDLS